MPKSIPSLLFALALSLISEAQVSDTLRVMHYNLLNYRNVTSFCTESNNNSDKKDQTIKTIIQYAKPDILTVNEMGANWLNPSKLLNNALNKDGIDYYDQAEFASNGSSSLANMLFFNKNKLVLYGQTDITKDKNNFRLTRSIDLYTLYYKDEVALAKGDTNFILVAVAHLKAGSTSSDKSAREKEANALMDHFNANNDRINYLLCGDFNTQSSSEASYQAFTNHSNTNIRFYDPVDAAGTWHDRAIYSNLHTQSTRTSSNGCYSGGGLDDRLDFILCGNEVLQGDYDLKYLDGSYEALGQDSKRFNGSVNIPDNIAVPKNVADALYNTSDHLPVIMDLVIKTQKVSVPNSPLLRWSVVSPMSHQLQIEARFPMHYVNLYSIDGSSVFKMKTHGKTDLNHPLPELRSGIYLLEVLNADGIRAVKKVVID